MKSLDRIIKMEMLRVPQFTLDSYQSEVLSNLYLEFFFENCRFLITPSLDFITTGTAKEDEIRELTQVLNEKTEVINKLKQYIMYNLSHFSSLLESNSYYITQNKHLVIARFVPFLDDYTFELKLYTIPPEDLPANYTDKIYLGRDYISMKTLRREHFGLKFIRNGLIDQFLNTKERAGKFQSKEEYDELAHEFLSEIEELIGEFAEAASEIIESYPVEITLQNVEIPTITEVNTRFRELKHILIEIDETIEELLESLYSKDMIRTSRYVIKFRKDIINNINYIMLKVNGRISDAINRIHG